MMNRVRWIDQARGAAIVLVIVAHADLIARDLGYSTISWLEPVWEALNLVRMPSLLLLSGLILPASLRKPTRQFLIGKLSMILWPYLLWALLRAILDPDGLPPWHPEQWLAAGYLWFLFYLLVYYGLALLVRALCVPYIAVAVSLWAVSWFDFGELSRIAFYGVFFFVGAALWSWKPGLALPRRAYFIVPIAVVAAVSWVISALADGKVPYGPAVLLAVAPTMLLLWLFQQVDSLTSMRVFGFIGRNSIVYYVTHFPLVAVGVRVIGNLAPEATPWGWLILTPIVLIICTLLAHMRSVPPIGWLYVAPARLAGKRSRKEHSRAPHPE